VSVPGGRNDHSDRRYVSLPFAGAPTVSRLKSRPPAMIVEAVIDKLVATK
jgi:hypothetical protein